MKVIIFGIGDLAKQLLYYLNEDDKYQVEGFCVDKEYYMEDVFLGKRVFVFEECIDLLDREEYKFIVGIGYKTLRARKQVYEKIKANGFSLINYIHPTANIYGNVLGEGNIILPNVTVEIFSTIDDNNIIWSNNLICHDAIIGNHNFIAAGSLIGGFTKILDNNFIGFNSTIIQNIEVNKEVLIGAKSLLIKSPDDYSVYYGSPAKKIKTHKDKGIQIL